MKANKVTVTITIEALHIDCVAALAADAVRQIDDHANHNGELIADDGDSVKWQTKAEAVEF